MRLKALLTKSQVRRISCIFSVVLLLTSSTLTAIVPSQAHAATTTPNVAKISFTFDDGIESAYTQAEPTLAKYGLTGTDYVISGCVGMTTEPNTCNANNDVPYMSWDQIKALQADGWEIGSHTEDHDCMASSAVTDPDDCTNAAPLTAAQLTTELAGSQQAIQAELGTTAATDFAWPYGDYGNLSLSVAAKYYASTRGFADDDGNTLNTPVANNTADVTAGSYAYNDLLLHDQQMQASPVPPTWQICNTFTNSTFTVAQAEQCIDNAITNNQWLILIFHNITTTPDLKVSDGSYDQSTANLDAIAAYAAAKQTAGLAKVVNINSGIVTGANMMPNGEFQAGLTDGWTTDDPTDITLDNGDNGRYPDPQNSILLKSAAGATATSETHLFAPQISVTPGTTYDLKNYLNMLGGGSVNFYIDEYNSAGQWISGVDPSAGMAYSTAAKAIDVGDVDFSYTPSSTSVASAALQVIVKGTGVNAYYSGAQWFIPGSTTVADTTPPTTPGTPTAAALTSSKQPTVSWSASTDSGSGLASPAYTLEWSQDPTFATVTGQETTNSASATPSVTLADGTWYFRVLAADNAGNVATSAVSSAVVIDSTPPVISAVTSTPSGSNGAVITWTTNEPATSMVNYGTTNVYGTSTTADTTLTTSHTAIIAGLLANTTYHFQIVSADAASNTASSTDYTFTTGSAPDTTPPSISNVGTSGITTSSATLSWLTDESSTSQVNYGTDTTYGSTSTLDSTLVTNHSVNLSGLTAGTTYHYQVISTDASGNTATSTDYTFTTAQTTAIPGDINGDGVVDIYDLSIMASNWGKTGMTYAQGDLNGDGTVDIYDLSILATNWSK